MIDFDTYQELHPLNKYHAGWRNAPYVLTNLPTDDSEPKAPEIYLFPPLIPGFDLRRKKWSKCLLKHGLISVQLTF